MLRPTLLLLDEPSLGLAPIMVREIFGIVESINREEGLSVLIVEQNANLALQVARRAYLLEVGRVVLEGESDELARNDSVRRSYLGY
jgi:branched-chain amino acid transport system ATP-binding protein